MPIAWEGVVGWTNPGTMAGRIGYSLGSALMVAAAWVEWRWGIAAERRALEEVCRPLTYLDRPILEPTCGAGGSAAHVVTGRLDVGTLPAVLEGDLL